MIKIIIEAIINELNINNLISFIYILAILKSLIAKSKKEVLIVKIIMLPIILSRLKLKILFNTKGILESIMILLNKNIYP
jgi:hypothetical protein